MTSRFALQVLTLSCLVLPPLLAAEEVVQTDGRMASGALSVDGRGQLLFVVPGRPEPLPINSIEQVRFRSAVPPPFRIAVGHRVLLRSGERLTGQLVSLNKESLVLRAAWAERLTLPRAAVAAVTQLPGWQPLFVEAFTDGLKAWNTTGKPTLTGDKTEPVLLLNQPGQRLAWTPGTPLAAGRIGINFEERDSPTGARWLLEVQFGEEKQSQLLRILLAGAEGYPVEAVGLDGTAVASERSPGWHRLTIQFTPRSLRVLCDNAVLFYNLERRPGGPLVHARLACQEAPASTTVKGALALAAFSVARAVEEAVRPAGDQDQDEVWLAGSDQLFGEVVQADGRTLEIQGRFGRRGLSWTDVRGCYLRRSNLPQEVQRGAVRLSLRSGLDNEPDLVDGSVVGLDERRLRLHHAWLGDLVLERNRLQLLRPLATK